MDDETIEARLDGKRILIVDDDPEVRDSIDHALRAEGAATQTCGDGNTAVRICESDAPQLVVLDMMLPKRSGFLVLEKIKKGDDAPRGGNNSSDVRVWLNGHMQKKPWPAIGDLTSEFDQPHRYHYGELNQHDVYEDDKKLAILQAEPQLTIYLEHRLVSAACTGPSISDIVVVHTRTSQETNLVGSYFVDCTGDGCLGIAAGADHVVRKKEHMGPSNLWYTTDTGQQTVFPACPWALDLHDKPFPGRFDHNGQWGGPIPVNRLGGWFWESGFDLNPLTRVEDMRDWNFRAM